LIRYEQMQKDFKEADDSWETETMITTFDLDEIETEIEVDYFVSFELFNKKYMKPNLNFSMPIQMRISTWT